MFLLIASFINWNQFLQSFLVLELSAVWIPFNAIKPDGTLLMIQKNACIIQRKAENVSIQSCNVWMYRFKKSWLGYPVEFLNLLFSSFGELFSFHVTAYYQIILTNWVIVYGKRHRWWVCQI